MPRTTLLLPAVVAAGLLASPAALATGKPPSTGAGCKPAVMVVVKGTAAADAAASSLSLTVTGGNHWARLMLGTTGTATTVNTGQNTKVDVGGKASVLTSIKKGDNVLVQYRTCKADLTGKSGQTATTFVGSLTPRKVIDLGTGSESDDNEKD
jgi:hypothetical protein